VATLRARPEAAGRKLGAIGYCMGGRLAYLAAARPASTRRCPSTAAASTPARPGAATSRCPVQFHYAEHDDHIPLEAVERVRQAMAGNAEVHVYPGASTASTAGRRASYHAPSAALTSHGRPRCSFATTPPMPSYLVAVSVGRYDALQGRAGKVPLRVLTAPGKGALGAYALQATQQILPYYEAYFGLPYALPKLDQLAVPSTRNGAMEDWGLISYAEGTLLFDPATSNPQQQRGIFSIVAHEVAHQWFGNLVTAASWEEIWLNEAFATWMADKASAHFNPQWQLPLRHRRQIDHAMERDGGASTRAIRSGPVREDSVFDVFDDITYTKGGAVLGMLEQWIGEDAFRRGLAAYMKERRLSNATAGDLWFHMGRASGSDVSGVAASWTDQKGFPLVRVDSRCEAGSTWLDTRQQAFTHDGSPRSGLWQVPLVLLHDGRLQRALLTQEQQRLQLPGCPALPTVVNPQGVGFYRVAYGDAQRQALAAGFGTLPPAAQVTLLSDSFALAQAGQLPLSAWLDLLPALADVRGDTRPALLGQAQAGLRVLDEALAGTPAQEALRSTARALLAPELRTLGWDRRPGDDAETDQPAGRPDQ
jgi:aminopeptidase N